MHVACMLAQNGTAQGHVLFSREIGYTKTNFADSSIHQVPLSKARLLLPGETNGGRGAACAPGDCSYKRAAAPIPEGQPDPSCRI